MATYEYQCPKCGEKREVIKRISKADTKEWCEKCRCIMDKLISKQTSFVLKGKGWFNSGGY